MPWNKDGTRKKSVLYKKQKFGEASSAFKLKSGNSPLFKVMGSSPFKDNVPAKTKPPKKDTTKKEDKKGVYKSITGKKFKDTKVGSKIAKVKDKIETWKKNNPEKSETLGKISEALGETLSATGAAMEGIPTPTGGEELMDLAPSATAGPSESAEIPSITAEAVGSELPDAPSGPVMKKSPTKIYGKGGKRKKNWKKY